MRIPHVSFLPAARLEIDLSLDGPTFSLLPRGLGPILKSKPACFDLTRIPSVLKTSVVLNYC
jgi:hypothetical protein